MIYESKRKMTYKEQEAYDLGYSNGKHTAMCSPWVKTSDRLPTAEDGVIGATGEPEVLAVTKYAHGYFPDMKMVSEIREVLGRKYYPYWMPLPPLPENAGAEGTKTPGEDA